MLERLRLRLTAAQNYKEAFCTLAGKEVLKDLLRFCHYSEQIHNPNNSHDTAFKDGKRRVALRILGFLGMDTIELNELIKREKQTEVNYND